MTNIEQFKEIFYKDFNKGDLYDEIHNFKKRYLSNLVHHSMMKIDDSDLFKELNKDFDSIVDDIITDL